MLFTNVLFLSVVEDNSMLKDRFAITGIMMSSLLKVGNLTNSSWFWLISLGLCMMITFCLVAFMPLTVLREWPGYNFFSYSIFRVSLNMENYGHPWAISYAVMLYFLSIILRVREANSLLLSLLYWV